VALWIAPVTLPTHDMLRADGVPAPFSDSKGRDLPHMRDYRARNMRSQAWCKIHDERVAALLVAAGYDGTQPVANDGKHFDCDGDIIGWWKFAAPRNEKIQNESPAHRAEPTFTDYATNVHGAFDGETPPSLVAGGALPAPTPAPSKPRAVATPPSELMRADKGPAVKTVQQQLIVLGYDLGKWGADGSFGAVTEAAVKSFQRDYGLPVDGIVDADVMAALRDAKPPDTQPTPGSMPSWAVEPIPFVAAANFTKAGRTKVTLIVIHTMEAPEKPTTAESVAAWFAGQRGKAPMASAHYCCDSDSVVQGVDEADVAYAAPGANAQGIQFELAGYAKQSASDWSDDDSQKMLDRVARIAAKACKRWSIPVVKLGPEDLLAGRAGFCGHVDASKAFKRSNHYDPGQNYPWDAFLECVRGYLKQIG
jgi:N-acetyl-anhydromuramyl-L-alanine amidase AmpD